MFSKDLEQEIYQIAFAGRWCNSNNFSKCVKTADWDGRKVETLFFDKENRVS